MRRARVLGPGLASISSWKTLRANDASPNRAIGGFSQLLRRNGLFAVSEISKGVVIMGIGDFATADAVGEFVSTMIPSAAPLAAVLAARQFS